MKLKNNILKKVDILGIIRILTIGERTMKYEFNETYFRQFLPELMAIDSPTGFTKQAIKFLKQEAEKMNYVTSVTEKGNLIITVANNTEKALGVCAHTDTLGLMVRSIKSNGNLAITKIGGPLLSTLDGEYCKIYTRDNKVYTGTIISVEPSIHVYPEAKDLKHDEKHLEVRLDEIVKTKEDTEKLGICTGDYICYDPKCTITDNGFIKSRFLDDKLSVAILFNILKYLADNKINLPHSTDFIITCFEEVGHGNSFVPSRITELLGVDMGCIGDDLNCTEYDVSICAKDSSGPYDYDMTTKLINYAKTLKLNHAVDIYPMYGSDVSAALGGSNNLKGALVGPGVFGSHGMERSHIDACKASFNLVLEYLVAYE